MITAEEAKQISSSCKNKESDIEFNKLMDKINANAKLGYTGIREEINLVLKYKVRLEKLGYEVYNEKPFETNIPVQCNNAIISWV